MTAGWRPRLDACSRVREQTRRGRGAPSTAAPGLAKAREDCPGKTEATGCGAGPALVRPDPAGRPGAPASAARRNHGGTPPPRTRRGRRSRGGRRELPHDMCPLPTPRLGSVTGAAECPDLDAAAACHRGRRRRAERKPLCVKGFRRSFSRRNTGKLTAAACCQAVLAIAHLFPRDADRGPDPWPPGRERTPRCRRTATHTSSGISVPGLAVQLGHPPRHLVARHILHV